MRLLFLFITIIIFFNLNACKESSQPDYTKHSDTSTPLDDSIGKKIMQRFTHLYQSKKQNNKTHASLTKSEISLLKDGDIILRKGFGTISDFIALFLNESYPVTHCAFYISKGFDQPMVLHTISNESVSGMFTEPLKN